MITCPLLLQNFLENKFALCYTEFIINKRMLTLKKLTDSLKKNKYILISGLASLFIIMIVYLCFEIIPFGDKTIYRMDLYHQYGPLFSELYDRITEGKTFIYSWNSGLGSSFLGNFYNYLSSPISLIILLFGHENTFEAIAAMIAIKAVLSSMSMSYYLKTSQKRNDYSIAAFGVLYAFCAYFIAYYWNVMWIDSLYILPFIVLGIERIIDTGKVKTYMLALLLGIFSNYYIGFMLCIFSCIYFLYYYACSYRRLSAKRILLKNDTLISKIKNSFFLQSGIRFAFSSLAVGIILLFMLVPVFNILRSSSATTGTVPEEMKYYYDIFDFLANHLASLEPTIRSSGEDVLPNVYCGILTVLLLPLYIFSKRIDSREKLASVILLAVMYFSFNINYLNYFWHGLHFPNDLPYRQSFMYSFILVVLAYKAFKNIDEFTKRQIFASGIGVIAFIIAVQKITSKNVNDNTVYISIAFVVLFTVVLSLISSKKSQQYALSLLLLCSVVTESITANTEHYVANQTKTAYAGDYADFKSLQDKIDSADTDLFYRTELSYLRARMDPCWYGYNGVSTFSSMAYEKVSNLQKYIGLYGNKINSHTYNPQTPIYNSMYSLKYIYDKNSLLSDGKYYSLAGSNDTFSVYENKYMLNIAYPVSENIKNWDAASYDNPVEVQERYFYLATGISDVFDYYNAYSLDFLTSNLKEGTSSLQLGYDSGTVSIHKEDSTDDASLTVQITAESKENIYIYINSRNLDTVTVYTPKMTKTMTVSDGYILDIGHYNIGDKIDIVLPIKEDRTYATVDFRVFSVNNEKFTEGYEQLKDGQIEYTKFDETVISGTFKADENEVLYTSIPYDIGWNVYIDGKKVDSSKIFKISDAQIGVEVDAGEHEITFSFTPPGLKNSIIISAVFTIFLLLLYIFKERKMLFFKNRKANIWQLSRKLEKEAKASNIQKEIEDEVLTVFNEQSQAENTNEETNE